MKFAMAILLAAITTITCFAQHGGKAEPKRIEFAAGKSSIVLAETLANGSEMEYVFAVKKGQHVIITNPSPGLFDFRIFSEEFDTETEFDSSRSYTFDVPATGDYNFFVRKKMVKSPRTARFHISMAIQ